MRKFVLCRKFRGIYEIVWTGNTKPLDNLLSDAISRSQANSDESSDGGDLPPGREDRIKNDEIYYSIS